MGVDAVRGKRGRRENRDGSGPGGLRIQEVLAQYKAFSELGKGAGFSESMRNPFIPHTQAARAEVNTRDAGSKAGVLRGLLSDRGLCHMVGGTGCGLSPHLVRSKLLSWQDP